MKLHLADVFLFSPLWLPPSHLFPPLGSLLGSPLHICIPFGSPLGSPLWPL